MTKSASVINIIHSYHLVSAKLLKTGRCRAAQLASIRLMSGQVSRDSAGEYQADERADEQAGIVRLRWKVSGR